MNYDSPVTDVKGVGPKTADVLSSLGITCVRDMLEYYPREYSSYKPLVNISDIQEGYWYALEGQIGRLTSTKRGGMIITSGQLLDGSDSIMLTWFNMPYLKNSLNSGSSKVVWGRVKIRNGRFVMEQPTVYSPDAYERKLQTLEPVYHLTAGIKNNAVIKIIKQILEDPEMGKEMQEEEILPAGLVRKFGLISRGEAIRKIHFPVNREELNEARNRLVFEEFLLFILSFRYGGKGREENSYPVLEASYAERLRGSLPYELTRGQQETWQEILADLRGPYRMNRLVQGDVGSGKTIVSCLAILSVIENGYQGALMAPTEVLAEQHYLGISEMIRKAGLASKVGCCLLVGSMSVKEKRIARERIREGSVQFIIGTHALIQESVEFHKLGLVVVDEQHRFGVRQREILAGKSVVNGVPAGEKAADSEDEMLRKAAEDFDDDGKVKAAADLGDDTKGKGLSHVLVMSATPIPRTLALILYGNMDISAMKGLPGNRLPIKNAVVDTSYRPKAYRFMLKEIQAGRQCYVICPMIEENENLDGEDVIGYGEKLRSFFPPEVKIGILHGRMKGEEKNLVMRDFACNKIQILVSTTVVEVGVDVPNATVMVVENAERFGLSTLHQLRGRVGRGGHQSFCILISSMEKEHSRERLETLAGSNDGFFIAQEDLRLRGPGELLGDRQSGDLNFSIGDVYADAGLLIRASECVERILWEDPGLEAGENKGIRKVVMERKVESVTL